MAYRDAPYDEDDEANLDDREEPDEADTDPDGRLGADLVPCPYCGKAVYEEADVCPHCGSFIVAERVTSKRPWWVVAAAIVLLAAVISGWLLSVMWL